MSMKRFGTLVVASAAGLGIGFTALAAPSVLPAASAIMLAADPEPLTEQNIIAGTMDIEFGTRTNLDSSGDLKTGSPAVGAKDKYRFALTVAKTTEFTGEISRQPNLYSKLISKRKQDAELFYSIDLTILNPKDLKQKKTVGKWVGTVPIDTASGAYDLGGGKAKQSALRIKVDPAGAGSGFESFFTGRLVGKAEKKESLAQYTFKRVVGDRTVQVVVKKSDPMRFENIKLAQGPVQTYPETTVNGRLDYDYETGNWYTDGIRFKYTFDGKEIEDVVTGSIKWVEDSDRQSNGKGYYEFNLRYNEEKNKKAAGEGDAFAKLSEEDAFFAVDDTVPSLTGRVSYVDTMPGGSDSAPTSSKVTYSLNANKLTKQQAMNFFKLWLLGIGPTNDE
jgi:hypothetical protein